MPKPKAFSDTLPDNALEVLSYESVIAMNDVVKRVNAKRGKRTPKGKIPMVSMSCYRWKQIEKAIRVLAKSL